MLTWVNTGISTKKVGESIDPLHNFNKWKVSMKNNFTPHGYGSESDPALIGNKLINYIFQYKYI